MSFPVRVRTGNRKGKFAWAPLRHWRVLRTLHNPRDAGALVYGRRKERITPEGKPTFEIVPRDQWVALIPDAHPGYILLRRFELHQQMLGATPGRTAQSGPRDQRAKDPRCCRDWSSADGAAGG